MQAKMAKRADEKDKNDPLFPTVTSRYWVEAVSSQLCKTRSLTKADVAALVAIHKERERGVNAMHEWMRLGGILSAVLAVGAFAATEVPKETFSSIGMTDTTYGRYRLVVAAAIALLVYLTLSYRSLLSDRTRKLRRRVAFVTSVLAYCEIFATDEPASQTTPVGARAEAAASGTRNKVAT
jgi:hypothetical protein